MLYQRYNAVLSSTFFIHTISKTETPAAPARHCSRYERAEPAGAQVLTTAYPIGCWWVNK